MKERIPLFLTLFLLSLITAVTSHCKRSCGQKLVPYPFGFSSGCRIPLNCSSSKTQPLIADFPILNINADRIKIIIEASCNRPLQVIGHLYGPNYAPTFRNEFLLQNCESPLPCKIPSTKVYTNFETLACSPNTTNITCYSEYKSLDFIDYNKVNRTNCKYFMSSILVNQSGVLESEVIELGWWLPGNCSDFCSENAICNQTIIPFSRKPGFTCRCKSGLFGDGYRAGSGCRKVSPDCNLASYISGDCGGTTRLAILIGGVGFCLVSLLGVWWLYRRRMVNSKRKFFERNGGLLLKKKLCSDESGMVKSTKLFSAKELEIATEHFNNNKILGRGGQGMVYKGTLQNGKIVAIKKSKMVNEGQLDEFINEIVILSNIDHRNVVKLLGCCLETEVPLLVYEFIPNGTLSNLIHQQRDDYPRSWNTRLRIASEIAAAISHLHTSASVPIFHRDIKSDNILLDENFRAKVSDFGISRSVNIDQTHLTTQILGTIGYIDPEYFQSSQYTEKSDVYSFGVVLVELLTGEKPIYAPRSQGLVSYFLSSIEENHLLDVLDVQNLMGGQREEIFAVAHLAKDCLHMDGRIRPTMKQVAMELERIRNVQGCSPIQPNQEYECLMKQLAAPARPLNFVSSSMVSLNLNECSIISESDVHPLRYDTV